MPKVPLDVEGPTMGTTRRVSRKVMTWALGEAWHHSGSDLNAQDHATGQPFRQLPSARFFPMPDQLVSIISCSLLGPGQCMLRVA